MKKYIEPKIKAVTLNANQAVLEVCAVGGIYLNSNTPPWCGGTTGATGPFCIETPKGSAAESSGVRSSICHFSFNLTLNPNNNSFPLFCETKTWLSTENVFLGMLFLNLSLNIFQNL